MPKRSGMCPPCLVHRHMACRQNHACGCPECARAFPEAQPKPGAEVVDALPQSVRNYISSLEAARDEAVEQIEMFVMERDQARVGVQQEAGAVNELAERVADLEAALAAKRIMVGWFAKHKRRWLFTEDPEQVEQWRRQGILEIVGAFKEA